MTQNNSIYHTDAAPVVVVSHAPCIDGTASALVFYICRRSGILPVATRFIPTRHGYTASLIETTKDCSVYMVDFSLPKKDLLELKKKAASLQVLDHHVTAQNELKGLDFCLFDMSRSGAQLALDYVNATFGAEIDLQQAYPSLRLLIDYVGDRDLWRFALPDSKLINHAISTLPLFNDEETADEVFSVWLTYAALPEDKFLERTKTEGELVARKLETVVTTACSWAVVGQLLGRTEFVPIVNIIPQYVSETLNRILVESQAPYAIGWYFDGNKYVYSLRSLGTVDVSAIAKQYGGGGHASAAGFLSRDFFIRTAAIDAYEDLKTKRRLGIAS